jgi:hypothetical protein
MSDTPKTDTNEFTLFIGVHSVSIENVFQAFQFARQLERELNECSRIAAVRLDYIKQLTTEKEAANDRIKRLEDAGDYLCAAAAFLGWHDKIEAWNQAKEAK